jgi:5'-methylthioadenosine phosphorylase
VTSEPRARIAVIGGSGLYEFPGLTSPRDVRMGTPFGDPSDAIRVGWLGSRSVAFLARHGRKHTLSPSEINFRANIYALKLLGVERVLSVSAVGSLREGIERRDVVVPDQFVDRTRARVGTFFGGGVVAHVGLADPFCPVLRRTLVGAAKEEGARVHDGGTYLCIEGPAFSTRAESFLYRSWGMDVIGMTNLPEARLAREAELCYGTLALVTDYDCWREAEGAVSVEAVIEAVRANAALAVQILARAIAALPEEREGCLCGEALRDALLTPPEAIPPDCRERLGAILGRYLPTS